MRARSSGDRMVLFVYRVIVVEMVTQIVVNKFWKLLLFFGEFVVKDDLLALDECRIATERTHKSFVSVLFEFVIESFTALLRVIDRCLRISKL